MTRLILVTGTRADWGLWQPILREVEARPGIDAMVLVTAMHLDPRFGGTVRQIVDAGTQILARVPCTPEGDSRAEMAAAIGAAMTGMAPVLAETDADWLVTLGDRGEQLAAALVAVHVGIPVAHLHGGETSLGAVDNVVRDLVSRCAGLHLVASVQAAERVARIAPDGGVVVTGAPGLDAIREREVERDAEILARHALKPGSYLLLLFHPETVGSVDPGRDMDEVLAGLRAVGMPIVGIAPNADAGGRVMLERLLAAEDELVSVHRSLPHAEYVALLANAAVLVGNSSSGLIEAPLLGVPAVNVGRRQAGRLRGDNVIDVGPDQFLIASAVRGAATAEFRRGLSGISPYGDGRAAPRIVQALQRADRMDSKRSNAS